MIAVLAMAETTLLAGLWAVVGYADFTHQKVRHVHLLCGLTGVVVGYCALAAHTGLGVAGLAQSYYFWGFYSAAAYHLALSSAVAVALWQLRMWPAGDAKLFALLAALYPLIRGSFAPGGLFLSLLINTFLPAAAFLFARSLWYVFETRLRAGRDFCAALGWRRELAYFAQRALEAAKGLAERAAAFVAAAGRWRELDALGAARSAARGAAALLPQAAQWLMGMSFMAVASYYLKGAIDSPLALALLCMALLTLWNQVVRVAGKTTARLILAAGTAALIAWKPLRWDVVLNIFGNLTLFGFCMFLGMNAAMGMIAGGGTALMSLAVPFLLMGLSMALAVAGQLLAAALGAIMDALRGASMAAQGAALAARDAADAARPGIAERLIALKPLTELAGLGALSPYAATAIELAGLGVFFGLSLVFVRLWDEEVRPTHRAEALAAHLLLAPAFADRVSDEDPEFFETHLGSLYADGLTAEQADALKAWCAGRGIDKVPLAPTVSFASWIFLGAFVSLLLGGRHVLEVLL